MLMLRKIPLFEDLDDSEIRELENIAIKRRYPKNSIVVNEGDQTASLFLILTGRAIAYSYDPESDRRIVFNTFKDGDYFGEMSFIDNKPRSAAVETQTKATMLEIPKSGFDKVFKDNPQANLRLLKGLLKKVRKARNQIEDLAFRDVYGRIAVLFAELKNEDGIIQEKLTHQEIAHRISASRKTVSRIMSQLKEGGFIAKESGSIKIQKKLPYR